MIEGTLTAVTILVLAYFILRWQSKPRCDFCNDKFRLSTEGLSHYGDSLVGEPRMYCSHCVDWWERRKDEG